MLRESLTNWDSKINPKAPLTDKQNDAFIELSIKCQWTKRPLPNNLHRCASRESTSSSTSQRIENAEQFFSWFSEIEDKIEESTDYQHRAYVRQLRDYTKECTTLRDEMDSAKGDLETLHKEYISVSSKTNDLHEACEKLLAEQTQLVNDAECICSKLCFFTELDRVSSKLNSNKISVTDESFVPLLNRIDECMSYLKANPQYKQSAIYLAQFSQCLNRALSLVRSYVGDILRKATLQVLPHRNKLSEAVGMDKDESIQIEDAFTLFYGKFQTNAPRVKSLLDDINLRTEKSPEYEDLLTDCYQCYFTQRRTILKPSIAKAIRDLQLKYSRDYCSLMRSGNSFLVHICEDEYALFMHFFSRSTPLLDEMLGEFCQMMYDLFRPLLIHILHLETLSELCSIIMVEMLQEHVQNNSKQLKAFGEVCNQILADVQERLVYRTYIYIRSEIGAYKPAPGDIAYPEKLEMMQDIAESLIKDNKVDELKVSPFFDSSIDRHGNQSVSPADLHGMWYPTVRRTLVCLSKLYRCLDKATFQGLSQETLSMATLSLVNASELIAERKSELDGELFLIKHLLILREQIAPFQVSFSVKETGLDFSRIKDAARDLLSARSSLFSLNSNNALLQFLLDGTPQPMEMLIDSKREVDKQLKINCENFIKYVIKDLIGLLTEFMDKAGLIIEMNAEDSRRTVLLSGQPFADVNKVTTLVAETYKRVKRKQLEIRKLMHLYLSNKDTEFILFKPIKAGVSSSFQKLLKILLNNYSEEDRQIIACPSLEQVNLLMSAPRNNSARSSVSSLPGLTPTPAIVAAVGITPTSSTPTSQEVGPTTTTTAVAGLADVKPLLFPADTQIDVKPFTTITATTREVDPTATPISSLPDVKPLLTIAAEAGVKHPSTTTPVVIPVPLTTGDILVSVNPLEVLPSIDSVVDTSSVSMEHIPSEPDNIDTTLSSAFGDS